MFLDSQDNLLPDCISTDVCIIGAGAAGITVARSLVASALDVCLLESGGLSEELAVQALAVGDNVGVPYFPLAETRYRLFGGSTNRWAGWCRPLDSWDFEHRPWIPHTGWPIALTDMERHYEKAIEMCEIPGATFLPKDSQRFIHPLYQEPYVGGDVQATVWHGSPPTKFGVTYRSDFERAANVAVYLHTTAVDIRTNESASQVSGLIVARPDGKRFEIRARAYILAAGALETARILLSSDLVQSTGLGNEHDNVGRFFMEHPHVVGGQLILSPRGSGKRIGVAAIDKGIGGVLDRLRLRRPGGSIKCGYTLSEVAQRENHILNFSAHLNPVSRSVDDKSKGYRSIKLVASNLRSTKRLLRQVRTGTLPRGVGQQIKNVLTDLPNVAVAVYEEMLKKPTELDVYCQTEQSPNPNSRVTLGEDRDCFGVRRVRLDWQLSPLDRRSIRISQAILGEHLARSGLGTLRPEPWLMAEKEHWSPTLTGGHHHLGTARMSDDPKKGVVDKNCKVHGISNLYVSDGSVFPTGGYANPLLTIVALALRTADHIKSILS